MIRLTQINPSRFHLLSISRRTNYYTTLGVAKNSDIKAIKKAFRSKSVQCHPDKFPNDKAKETQFKNLSEAYTVLSDSEERRKYDSTLSFSSGSQRAQQPGWNNQSFDGQHGRTTWSERGQRGGGTRAGGGFQNQGQWRDNASPYERSEQWRRVYEELNKKRHDDWSRRNPDFGDFMNGRRGTDFKDFRKWYNAPASDFEKDGKSKQWADETYDSTRFSSRERYKEYMDDDHYAQMNSFKREQQKRLIIKQTAISILILILFLQLTSELDQAGNPYKDQYAWANSQYRNTQGDPRASNDLTVAELVKLEQERLYRKKLEANAKAALEFSDIEVKSK